MAAAAVIIGRVVRYCSDLFSVRRLGCSMHCAVASVFLPNVNLRLLMGRLSSPLRAEAATQCSDRTNRLTGRMDSWCVEREFLQIGGRDALALVVSKGPGDLHHQIQLTLSK